MILIHLKMTGHLLYGKYVYSKNSNSWSPRKDEKESLHDPYNRFIHVVFTLNNGKHIAFCDSRKFGKITLIDVALSNSSKHLKDLGVEPLSPLFTYDKFIAQISKKKQKKIKTVLMDQSLIVGIGNIYSDEILWSSGVHPESKVESIGTKNLKSIFKNIIDLLHKGISFGGDSMSDYRNIDGEKGSFQGEHNAYRKSNEKCKKRGCAGVIERKVVDGRSSHFCSIHQKLYSQKKHPQGCS
jgi:formamidopyrimidine-DNA glycosylase